MDSKDSNIITYGKNSITEIIIYIYIYILLEEKIDGTDCQHVVLNSQRNKAIWRECGIYFLIAVTRLLWSCLSTLMNVRMTDFLAW